MGARGLGFRDEVSLSGLRFMVLGIPGCRFPCKRVLDRASGCRAHCLFVSVRMNLKGI